MLGCALAGCGGADPAASDPPSVSPSPSPTGPTAPALPRAARQHTKAGAIAFVRHYIDLINYAQASGDVAVVSSASVAGCSSCNSTNRYLHRLHASGGQLVGGRTAIREVLDALSPTLYGDYVIDLAITIKPSVEIKGDGHRHRYKGGRNVLSVFPKWTHGKWKVAQWTRAK